MARHYGLSPAEQEDQQYLSQNPAGPAGANPGSPSLAKAQTLARSTGNPRAQRYGQQFLERRSRDEASAIDEQERDAARVAREAEAAARDRDALERAEEARRVRAASAAGAEIETDVETGRRSIATHPDGAPKFKAGPVGAPVPQQQRSETRYVDPENPERTFSPFLPVGDGGAVGANTGEMSTSTTWLQRYRNDRGQEIAEPLPEKTDPKTAEKYVEVKDGFGVDRRQVTGTDPKAAQLLDLDKAEARVALQRNTIAQTKAGFEPRFKPVEAEYKAAKADWEKLKENEWTRVEGKDGKPATWQRFDSTGKQMLPPTPDEVARYQKRVQEVEGRWKRAEKAYTAEAPKAEHIAKAEESANLQALKITARRIAIENGLPEGDDGSDGGTAAFLASAATGLPVPEAETARKLAEEPPTPAPQPPADLDSFKTAFPSLQAPENIQTQPTSYGMTSLVRDGQQIARVDARKGTPVVILNATDDLLSQAAVGQLGGVPVYLRDGRRQTVEEEATWVAKLFAAASSPAGNPMNPGDGASGVTGLPSGSNSFDRENAIHEMGGTPQQILAKVKSGELSMQSGEAIMRGLYESSLKVDDPSDPATFEKYLKSSYKQDALWQAAVRGGKKDEQDRIRGEFVSEWYAQNRGMPGVTWDMMQKARGITAERSMVDHASDVVHKGADMVAELGGSMGGLLAKYPAMGILAVQQLWDPHADAALDDMQEITGRANTNFTRGLEATRKQWLTDDGKARLGTLDKARAQLRATIAAQDVKGAESEGFKRTLRTALNDVTEAAYQLHSMGLEEGWEVTRDDLDPNKDKALGSALLAYMETGDPAMWDAFSRRLLLDKGNRQAEMQMKETTEGKSKLAAAFASGVYSTDAEAVIEIASDLLTLGTSKLVTATGKATQLAAKSGEASAAMTRIARAQRYFTRAGEEAANFGKVVDTLAQPASKVGRAYNKAVDIGKVAAVSGGTEAFEEGIAGLAEPGATPMTVAQQAGVGALAGIFLAPMFTLPTDAVNASRATYERKKQVADFAAWYNRKNADSPDYKPITPAEAEASLAMLDPEQHRQLLDAHQVSAKELAAAQQEMADAQLPGGGEQAATIHGQWNEAAASRLSKAVASHIEASNALSGNVLRAVEAAQSTKGMDPAQRTRTLGLMKAATGRGELLTKGELSAIGGLQTREGQPYFADVNGKTVFTAEGRAEVMQDSPLIGALIQTDESRALLEASTQPTHEQNPQGQPQPQAPEEAPSPGQAPGQAPAPVAGGAGSPPPTPAVGGSNAAAMEAAEYQAYRTTAPDAPDVAEVVVNAISSGRPVSASMARAAGVDMPGEYQLRGNQWEKSEGAVPVTAPNAAEQTAEPTASKETRAYQPEADRTARLANDAVPRAEARFPGLAGRFTIDGQSEATGFGAAHMLRGRVVINLADAAVDIGAIADDAEAAARLDAVLEEEVIHIAQLEAALAGGRRMEDTYADIWAEFTPEQQQAAGNAYQGPWDTLEPWQQAAEAVRMLVQQRMDGQVTELTKAFHRTMPERLLQLLRDAVEFLKASVLKGELPERVQLAIETIEGLLAEYQGKQSETGPTNESTTPTSSDAGPTSDTTGSDSGSETTVEAAPGTRPLPAQAEPKADENAPLRVLGLAIRDAAQADARLTKKRRRDLEFGIEDMADVLETIEPSARRAFIDGAIADWLQSLDKPAKQARTIDPPARERAFQILNSGDYPTLSAVFEAGKIAPRPNIIGLILSRKKSGKKLTNREIATLGTTGQWDDSVFQNHYEASGLGKVAREILSLIMAKPGEGTPPNVMAGMVEDGMDSPELWARIGSELADVAAGRRSQRSDLDPNREWTEEEIAAAEAKGGNSPSPAEQREAFDAANTPAQGDPMPVANFTPAMIGQTVTVDGEVMRVTDVEMDSLGMDAETVILDDHLRFGRQILDGGDVLYVETEEVLFSSPQRALDFGTSGGFNNRDQLGLDFGTPAAAVEKAAAVTDTEPTDGQKEAGNYRKGKVTLHGMTISIENPRGSTRSGTDKSGKVWSIEMPHHYGYFLRTEARDGDHVDVFIGPDPESTKVWIVNQIRPDTGRFDEHKVMLGFSSRRAAIEGYKSSYSPGWKGLGDLVETDTVALKKWLEGDTTKPARASDFTQESESAPGKPSAPSGIQDFGEKIHGARKDIWGRFKDSISRELPEEGADITILKSFPEPDYEVAIAQGVSPAALATYKAIRDAIPAKPRKSYKLGQWVQMVRGIHPFMQRLATGGAELTTVESEALGRLFRYGMPLGEKIKLYRDLGFPSFTKADEWGISTGSVLFRGETRLEIPEYRTFATFKGRMMRDLDIEGTGPAARAEMVGKIRERILAGLAAPAATKSKAIEFNVYQDRLTRDVFIGKKAVNGVVRLKTGFETGKAARQFIADNQTILEEQWNGLKADPDYRNQVNQPRQGPVRRPGDATPELFQDSFGFRGVQFGNWVEGDRRQVDINEAFDAFMDLAEALGIPPKAVSLDGSLGLAFGARGTGGSRAAAAHYEPGQVVINLTKKSGPGSLGHEWFHAFDNYFARLDKTGDTAAVPLDRFATSDNRPPANMRPEVWDAFRQIRSALSKGTFADRSAKLDEARSKPYFSTTIEKAARAFERYTVQRLAGLEVSNDYLVNIKKDFSPALPTPEEMDGGIRQAFDHLFNTLDTVETEKGVRLFSSPGRSGPVEIPDAVIGHELGKSHEHPRYEAAKAGDAAAALDLARDLVDDAFTAKVREAIGSERPLVVPVVAIEAAGGNKIPHAVAIVLADRLGLVPSATIVQSVRANRGGAKGLDRVFKNVAFDGPVEAGRGYVIVDDTLTQGGTFADMADHIRRGGGRVVAAVALTGKQYSRILRLNDGTLAALRQRFGDLEGVFREARGHGFEHLTESEARQLVSFRPAHAVRDRILAEGSQGGDGLDATGTAEGTALGASPAPQVAVDAALEKLPPIYRSVFEAVSGGATEADIAKKFSITPRAVENILNAVRSRLVTATTAASAAGLKPAMRDGKFDGGRPDLALSTIPEVAAVDQIRNESDIPGVREWSEVLDVADKRLAADYAGEYDKILEAAREQRQLSDVEVAIAKAIIARETIEGRITKAEDRVKLAMLIHGYRDIGTETARSLAIRRDPHKKPAERTAQFIAEALFTPDEATRAELRKGGKGKAEDILKGWMARVDAIKREMLAQGIDLEATLAAHRKRDAAVKQSEGESPRAKKAIDEAAARLTKRERSVVEALRSGSTYENAGFATGMTAAEAKAIYKKWYADIKATMVKSAQRFMVETLGASPAFELSAILEGLGVPDPDLIADNDADLDRVKKERKERAPKPPKQPKPKEKLPAFVTPELEAKWRELADKFRAAPLSTWRTLWQEEMERLGPIFGTSFERARDEFIEPWKSLWQSEMDLRPEGQRMSLEEWIEQPETRAKFQKQDDLFAEPVLETTGTFDLNDPLAMKEVINAFALARGTKMDAIMEFWRASILTGPQTHIVNAGSNALNIAWDLLPRRATEATVNALLGVVGQGSDRAASFAEFAPMAKQLRRAVQLAARNALRSWNLESRTFEAYARAEAIQLDFTGVGAEYIPPALGGKIGKVMRSLSFRAMTAADEFFKSLYSQMEVAAQAHRIAARQENLKGKAYDDRIAALMEPGSLAWLRAIDGAKRVTFQEDLDGDNPRLIRRLDQVAALAKQGRNMPWIGRPLTFFLPFIDTPLNVFKQAVEISPLGSFLAIADGIRALRRRIYAGKLSKEAAKAEAEAIYDRIRFVQDLTNQTVAWAAVIALQGLVEPDEDDEDGLPVITGTVPYKTTRRGERDNSYAVMPPQTIRVGSLQFSYARVEPFATMLASSVDLLVTMNRHGGMKPAVVSEAMARFKDQVKDKTFLQGISSLIDAIEDPDRFGERVAANIATGFVPNIIRQPLRESDTVVRDSNPAAGDGFFTAVAKRVGYSLAPQSAPAKLDVWGQPVSAARGSQIGGTEATDMLFRMLDPTNAVWKTKADPIDTWIFRYNLETADPKDRVAIEPIPNYLDLTPPGEKRKRVPINPADQAEANRSAGQAARSMLGDDWGLDAPLEPARAEQIRAVMRSVQAAERSRLKAKLLATPITP